MYKISYCIYSVSHFFKKLKKPFSSNQDEWLGWKDWLNKKFCDKFMEVNEVSLQETKLTPEQEQKNISALDNLTKAGADPQEIGKDSRFNDKVEILLRNKYLMNFLKQSKFDFGLSSYNVHSQLMKAINKTFNASTIEKMQEGKFAIDYVLNPQISDDEGLEIVDDNEFIIEDLTGSVDPHSKVIPNQQIFNNKENISKQALDEAWLATVKLIAGGNLGALYKSIHNPVDNSYINQIRDTQSEVINILYQANQDIVSCQDTDGNNAIHILASTKNPYGIFDARIILEKFKSKLLGPSIHVENKEGNNPLHLAVIANTNVLVDKIFKECSSEQKDRLLSAKNYDNNNILHLAVTSGNWEIVKTILQACNAEQKQKLLTATNSRGDNPLHLAVIANNKLLVKQILQECTLEQKQTLFAAVNEHGNNPIMEAIESKQYSDTESWDKNSYDSIAEFKECLAYLQERINSKFIQQSDNKFQSDLQKIRTRNSVLLEIDQQQLITVEELIHYNSQEDRVKLLKKAIFQQKENIIKLVLPTIDRIHLTNNSQSVLEWVLDIYKIPERIYMLNLLIDCGVNINIQNTVGETLLHKIVDVNQLTKDEVNCQNKIIEYLVHLGADVNIQNDQGNTPLHIELTRIMRMDDVQPLNFRLLGPRGNVANVDDRLLNVQLLLQNKANPTIQNKQGETPLDIIIKTGDLNKESHIKIFQLLLDEITDLRVKESDEVVQNRFDLITERYSKMQYPKFDILYCFAEYIAKQGISCQITKEQCQFLIRSAASKVSIAQEEARKQVAYIFKACFVLEESVIPDDIKKLMEGVTLSQKTWTKGAIDNVGKKIQAIKPESKNELEEKEIIEEIHGWTSPLAITILLNKTASAGDNAPSNRDNVFAQFVPESKDEGGDHEITESKIVGDISNGYNNSIVP